MKTQKNKINGEGFCIRPVNLGNQKSDILDFFDLNKKKYPFLLESVAKGNERARYSILFCSPEIKIVKEKNINNNFLNELDEEWKKNKIEQRKVIIKGKEIDIPFLGGRNK